MKKILASSVCLGLVCLATAQTPVIFTPSNSQVIDCSVYSAAPTTNYNSTTLYNYNSGSSILRTFINFQDVSNASFIPRNAIITSATFQCYANNVTGDNRLAIERVTSAWTETSPTYNTEPTYTTTDQQVSSSTHPVGFVSVSGAGLVNQVQYMVDHPHLNHGFRIHMYMEGTGTNRLYAYSSEYGTPLWHPKLTVEYVMPVEVNNADVVHESANGADDGIITAYASEGDGSYTYQWHDANGVMAGETSQTLSGVGAGWYGVVVTDGYGNTGSGVFLVGTKGETVNILMQPGPEFTKDAMIYNLNGGGYYQLDGNWGDYTDFRTSHWNWNGGYDVYCFYQLPLFLDPDLVLTQADMSLLYDNGSANNGDNSALFTEVSEYWGEHTITWNTMPTQYGSTLVSLPQISNQPIPSFHTYSLLDFWKDKQADPGTNEGWRFELQNQFTGAWNRRMNFHSSDVTTTGNRPKWEFEVFIPDYSVSYDPILGNGDITVDMGSMSGPFKYQISRGPIADMQQQFEFIRDTIFNDTLTIDSTAFFTVTDNNKTHQFSNLSPGVYHVAVFGQGGKRLYSHEVVLSGGLVLESSDNLKVLRDGIAWDGVGTEGKALMAAGMSSNRNGSIGMRVNDVTNLQAFGLIEDGSGFEGINSIEYRVEVVNGEAQMYDGSTKIGPAESITTESHVSLNLEGTSLKFYHDGNEVHSTEIPSNTGYRIAILTQSQLWMNPIGITQPTVSLDVNHIPCGQTGGVDVTVYNNEGNLWLTTITHSLKDDGGNVIGTDQGSYVLTESGEYTLDYTYTVGNSNPISSSITVELGHVMSWVGLNQTILGIEQNDLKGVGVAGEGIARGNTLLKDDPTGWIEFEPKFNVFDGNDASTSRIALFDVYGAVFPDAHELRFIESHGSWNPPCGPGGASCEYVTITPFYLPPGPIGIGGYNIYEPFFYYDATQQSNNFIDNRVRIERDASGNLSFKLNGNSMPIAVASVFPNMGVDPVFAIGGLVNDGDEFHNVITSFGCLSRPVMHLPVRELKSELAYSLVYDKLRVFYDEEYNDSDGELTYSIRNLSTNELVDNTAFPISNVQYGGNELEFDLNNMSGLTVQAGHVYVLTITNEMNEDFFVRFKLVSTI